MITVKQTDSGFERIGGNPVLLSLDGERKARLRVIMHESWTAKERAAFGVYQAEPFTIPDGKQAAGAESFEMIDGKLVQVLPVEDKPNPEPRRDIEAELRAEIKALSDRVAKLEGRADV